jgi:hypothetical protein
MRGVILRSRHVSREEKCQFSLDIGTLAELLDMYHGHEAKEPLDKVYALLGMCSDIDLSLAGLESDYNLELKTIMKRLVKFLFNDEAYIEAWNEKDTPLIKVKGYVLGQVSNVQERSDLDLGNRQTVDVILKRTGRPGLEKKASTHWTF